MTYSRTVLLSFIFASSLLPHGFPFMHVGIANSGSLFWL
jgi:uncharacterized membrane protein